MQTAVKRRAERWAASLLLAAALAGCDQLPTPPSPAGAPEQMSQQQLARAVQALGFRSEGMIDRDDYVIVEGDIALEKARLASVRRPASGPLAPRFQYHANHLVNWTVVNGITVDLRGLADYPEWLAAMRSAMADWNAIPWSHVRLHEGSSGHIRVGVVCVEEAPGVLAVASLPAGDGNPGKSIQINACIGYDPDPAQKKMTVLHELGHTLGFQHTDMAADDGDGMVHVPGTPTGGDAASVMNTHGGSGLLSDYDRIATMYMYPSPPEVRVVNDGGYPRISWTAPPVATGAFTVRLLHNRYERFGRLPPETLNEEWVLSAGSGQTAFLDTQHPWTGTSSCSTMTANYTRKEAWLYEVTVQYTNGRGGSGTWSAPVGTC